MNTQQNTSEKYYLVSFGNSSTYILHATASGKDSLLTKIEAELNGFLRDKFPDEAFAYYTAPRVEDIDNSADYASYPRLDAKAMEDIKDVLSREVSNMESQNRLDSNAPYANVNPAAADIPHILG